MWIYCSLSIRQWPRVSPRNLQHASKHGGGHCTVRAQRDSPCGSRAAHHNQHHTDFFNTRNHLSFLVVFDFVEELENPRVSAALRPTQRGCAAPRLNDAQRRVCPSRAHTTARSPLGPQAGSRPRSPTPSTPWRLSPPATTVPPLLLLGTREPDQDGHLSVFVMQPQIEPGLFPDRNPLSDGPIGKVLRFPVHDFGGRAQYVRDV